MANFESMLWFMMWAAKERPLSCFANWVNTPWPPLPPARSLDKRHRFIFMKTKTKTETTTTKPRLPVSREDRARTNAGKTVNSKVRSEGRTLAAMERSAVAQRIFKAAGAKMHNLE